MTTPWVELRALSRIAVSVFGAAAAEPPLMFDMIVLFEAIGNCEREIPPAISVNDGCAAVGTPEVEIWLIHFDATAARD